MEYPVNFIRAQGVDHYIQRLYVHWDVTTLCQYDCSYCYAKKQYKSKWGKPGNWEHHQFIIDELAKSPLPVFLGLLGGEPTLHQRYFELLRLITEKVLIHPDSRLYITSNGAKPTDFWAKHQDPHGKIYMLWSIHPEHVDEEQFENAYRNILLMNTKGYKTKVNLMLHPGKRHWAKVKMMYDRLSALDFVILHPHFIYHGFDRDVRYSKEFYEYFSFLENQKVKEFVFSTAERDYIMSDYEIFSNKLNRFKGWKCWQNNYEIRNDGTVSDQCFQRAGIPLPVDFFKNITAIEPKICPHSFCSCDGLMKIHKERLDGN